MIFIITIILLFNLLTIAELPQIDHFRHNFIYLKEQIELIKKKLSVPILYDDDGNITNENELLIKKETEGDQVEQEVNIEDFGHQPHDASDPNHQDPHDPNHQDPHDPNQQDPHDPNQQNLMILISINIKILISIITKILISIIIKILINHHHQGS